MKTRMAGNTQRSVAVTAVVLTLTAVAMAIPQFLPNPAAASAAATPQFILPDPHLQELWMTSMRSGWALGANDELYFTQNDGRRWTNLGKFPWYGFSVGDHGNLAWGVNFRARTTQSSLVVGAVGRHGLVWEHTVSVPWKPIIAQWSAAPTLPLAGLVLAGRTSPSTIAEQVLTFNGAAHRTSLAYAVNPVPDTEAPMTGVSIENAQWVWGISIGSGPAPGLWRISRGKATPVLLPIPHGLTHGPVGPMKPGPMAGPQFVNGTGFLAAEYQTISLSSQSQIVDALVYRTDGNRWVPIWHRSGYIGSVDFLTPKIGWVEWTPMVGSQPELLRSVNGGHTFYRVATPGVGKPFFITPQDGWWVNLSPTLRLWTTINGGRTWTRVRTRD